MSRAETQTAYIIGFIPSIEPDVIHNSTQVCPGLYRILRQCLYRHGLYNLMFMHKNSNKIYIDLTYQLKANIFLPFYLTDTRYIQKRKGGGALKSDLRSRHFNKSLEFPQDVTILFAHVNKLSNIEYLFFRFSK